MGHYFESKHTKTTQSYQSRATNLQQDDRHHHHQKPTPSNEDTWTRLHEDDAPNSHCESHHDSNNSILKSKNKPLRSEIWQQSFIADDQQEAASATTTESRLAMSSSSSSSAAAPTTTDCWLLKAKQSNYKRKKGSAAGDDYSIDADHRHRPNRIDLLFSRVKSRQPISLAVLLITTLLSVAIMYHHHQQLVHCLDSPVKIQRNKLQPKINSNNNSNHNVSLPSSEQAANTHQSVNISSEQFLSSKPKREDRVRRTNDNFRRQSPLAGSDIECPSNRLIQSLLPVEYVGSPAMQSQRQHLSRAYCDCTPDPFGWHLTCFAGSSTAAGLASRSKPMTSSGSSSGGRQSAALTEPLPNQLHPAFREPQLQRQYKQQVAAGGGGASATVNRRVNRSPTRWMGEDMPPSSSPHRTADGDELSAQPAIATAESTSGSDVSIHEGFGEETNTTPRPGGGSRSRTAANNSSSSGSSNSNSSNQAASLDSDSFLSLPSSASFSMVHAAGERANHQHHNHHHSSEDQETSRAATDSNEKLINQNNHNSNLMFQTVPVLFSVRYMKNNMIEIDCDQAAPNYKAAMFQGFNVNEVSSFTFNNCQLPSIPFSVLLHRSRTAANNQPAANQQQQQPGASPASAASSAARSGQSLSLRPRHQNRLLSKRSAIAAAGDDDDAEHHPRPELMMDSSSEALAASADQSSSSGRRAIGSQRARSAAGQPAMGQPATGGGSGGEPRIRSLAVNLNAIVEQRTLISLLTGLDLLEELQLNYMQLNLTNFSQLPAPIDLEADPSSSITTASAAEQQANLAGRAPPESAGGGGSTQAPPGERRTTSLGGSGQPGSIAAAAAAATTSSSSSTTTSAPSTQLLAASSSSSGLSNRTNPMSTALAGRGGQPMTTSTTPTMAATTTTTAATTTSRPAATSTGGGGGGSSLRRQSVSILKPVSTIATRPTISLGAPRGLMIAQATGVPPTSTASTVSTTTSTTTTTMPVAAQPTSSSSSTTSTTPASASVSTTTTTTTLTPTVPSVPLSTVTQQVRPSQQQQQQPASVRQTTSVRFPIAATSASSMSGGQGGNTIISVAAPSAGQSITYTSQAAFQQPASQQQQPQQQLSSQRVAPSAATPASSSLMASGASLAPNRLHSSPSGWFTSQAATTINQQQQQQQPQQPSAGARLSGLSGAESSVTSSMIQATTSSWPPTSGNGNGNGATGGLSAPINTPTAYAALNNNAFGIRTGSTSSQQFATSQQQQQRANTQQPATSNALLPTTSTSMSISSRVQTSAAELTSPFVAAGGRLSAAANQPPRRPQQQQQQQQQRQPSSGGASQPFDADSSFVDSLNDLGSSSSLASALIDNEMPSSGGGGGGGDIGDSTRARFKRDDSHERQPQQPRAAGLSSSIEEFELSFGELLPNLRSLKLESFIDLSQLTSTRASSSSSSSAAAAAAAISSGGSGGPRKPAGGQSRLARFKRQFQPNDVPKRDDDDHDDEAAEHHPDGSSHADETSARRAHEPEDSLLAEESNLNYFNSISPTTTTTTDQPPAGANEDDLAVAAAANSEAPARTKQLSLILVKLFSKLSRLRVLQLSSNDIPLWPDNVLLDSRNSLARLYLISNNIRYLSKSSFANLTELEALDLSSNQIRQLSDELFRDLIGLRNVRACRNLFRSLPGRLFVAAAAASSGQQQQQRAANSSSSTIGRSLEGVDFSKNRYLSQLQVDTFQTSRSAAPSPVTNLNLSDCSLQDQLAGGGGPSAARSAELLFASMPDLINVSLNGNRLNKLLSISGLFAKNSRLQRLDLSRNQLTTLSGALFNANASQISDLYLAHNQLSQIPEQFLFNLRKLRRLSLAHNRLDQLNPRMFFTNQLIESIDLSHNNLITLNTQQSGMIPFGNGANLKFLNLAHNNLTNFELELFEIAWSFYTNLRLLDLSNNQFDGQLSMPIFYTIADEMLLNLASNQIQSVSVEALMQHEQVLDRYAAFEAESLPGSSSSSGHHNNNHNNNNRLKSSPQSQVKVPTVNIRLTNNPIACDCFLEPLMSYSRRVAAATNPALLASIFSNPKAAPSSSSSDEASLSSGSRYSVLGAGQSTSEQQQQQQQPRQPQLFYQFKFNDLYCAKPANLQRRLLTHVSIGDLLCPIDDRRLCPKQCQCFYQSAFKTAIVDCNNRQLTQIPDQLTESTNFAHFTLNSSFSSGGAQNQAAKSVESIDKVIIRLDNNRLRSMEQLSKLFTVVKSTEPPSSGGGGGGTEKSRFVRLATAGASASDTEDASGSADWLLSSSSSERGLPVPQAQPLTLAAATINRPSDQQGKKSIVSPVMIARNMHHQSSGGSSSGRQRSRRETTTTTAALAGENGGASETINNINNNNNNGLESDLTTNAYEQLDNPRMSTAVLESAEEFRKEKKYAQLTCELYLDHNLIESIPESFLEQLDQVRAASMKSSLIPPQAALPTSMLEPPIHAKINHFASDPDPTLMTSGGGGGGRSMSNQPIAEPLLSVGLAAGHAESPSTSDSGSHLGDDDQQLRPLTAEKKAALIETINENVRLNQQQQVAGGEQSNQQQQQRVSVNPSLVVLSLRYNNLANINARTLTRLSKLIKSSNTKLYLGHNPINCSENFFASFFEPSSNQLGAAAADEMAPQASALATDGDESQTPDGAAGVQQVLAPADCPVGQLKTWLTRHHSSIGDLDELYCVHMPAELSEKLRLANASSGAAGHQETGADSQLHRKQQQQQVPSSNKWDHDHPWASSGGGGAHGLSSAANNNSTGSLMISKNGLTWNAELLSASAKLIDLNMYDLCPYSNIQLIDAASAAGLLSPMKQQILMSVAILFIMLSLCLLMMLVYFGDTQTILAFVYIHMNPIYKCLRLNESHLDGDKLYDAFVSYTDADRDIVMELIEKLEQRTGEDRFSSNAGGATLNRHQQQLSQQRMAHGGAGGSSRDTLMSSSGGEASSAGGAGDSSPARRTNLSSSLSSTLNQSSSRIVMNQVGTDDTTSFGPTGGSGSSRSSSSANLTVSSPALNGGRTGANVVQPHPQQAAAAAGNKPYRLCIHERDWLPGHLISWNIVNSVQNSRRTILILSKDFIKSTWFQVEFQTAYYQMLEDKIDRLIVIVRGDLPPKGELDKNLAFLLTTKTYLKWGEKWFWERLHYALPHRLSPPAMAKQQPPPLKQHHHRAASGKNGTTTSTTNSSAPAWSKSSSDLLSAAAGNQQLQQQQQRQKPLIMSSIGKDCSNLLLPVHHHQQKSGGNQSESSSQGSNQTRSSASSFLGGGGSGSGNLLLRNESTTTGSTSAGTATTCNDLLSAGPLTDAAAAAASSTTRLTIGPAQQQQQSSSSSSGSAALTVDSGRNTTTTLGSSRSSLLTSPPPPQSGITNIKLDGQPQQQANSKARAKKQEKLHTFVEQTITDRFNLSEL